MNAHTKHEMKQKLKAILKQKYKTAGLRERNNTEHEYTKYMYM